MLFKSIRKSSPFRGRRPPSYRLCEASISLSIDFRGLFLSSNNCPHSSWVRIMGEENFLTRRKKISFFSCFIENCGKKNEMSMSDCRLSSEVYEYLRNIKSRHRLMMCTRSDEQKCFIVASFTLVTRERRAEVGRATKEWTRKEGRDEG